jgi:hypothetical protein
VVEEAAAMESVPMVIAAPNMVGVVSHQNIVLRLAEKVVKARATTLVACLHPPQELVEVEVAVMESVPMAIVAPLLAGVASLQSIVVLRAVEVTTEARVTILEAHPHLPLVIHPHLP